MPDDIPDDLKIDIIVAVNDTIPHASHPFRGYLDIPVEDAWAAVSLLPR